MTPQVAFSGTPTETHRAAIKSLHRASPERPATSCAADVTMLELAARMAAGLPVTEVAVREVGHRYCELIVELGKQVDARMSAEADRLSADDLRLIDQGLGVLTSDYNDVPHEAIQKLMARLAAKVSP